MFGSRSRLAEPSEPKAVLVAKMHPTPGSTGAHVGSRGSRRRNDFTQLQFSARGVPAWRVSPFACRLPASRLWDFPLAANGADRSALEFAVPWYRSDFAVERFFQMAWLPPSRARKQPCARR